jgi:hypothetical protein
VRISMAGSAVLLTTTRACTAHAVVDRCECGAWRAIGLGSALQRRRRAAHSPLHVTTVRTCSPPALLVLQHSNYSVSAVVCTRARGESVANIVCVDAAQVVRVARSGPDPCMPKRKDTCVAANCSVRYSPTRSGCGGRQYVVQAYIDHAETMLKTGAAVSDWICLRHRNALQQRVMDATPQQMVLW